MNIIDELIKIVGESGLLQGGDVLGRSGHSIGDSGCQAKAIVRPKSTEEVSQVLRLCYQAGQSVVPLGGLSGLVNGTACSPEDIGLSLERMNAIESVDADAGTMVVQSGAVLQNVQERAIEEGWQFALDLGARGSATIGGNIATNAGGSSVVRYGMMREQVLGLEAVLADGTIISSMNEMLKNNAGYDLKQLFIGSEGTLGIVTRAVLRLRPPTPGLQTAFLALEDFASVTQLLRRLGVDLEGRLSAFEIMWGDHYRFQHEKGGHQAFLPSHYPYYVLVESAGADAEREQEVFTEVLGAIMEEGLLADAVIAQSETQAKQLWEMREDIESLFTKLSPPALFDVSLPIRDMETYVSSVEQRLKSLDPDIEVITFGHLGDGNLHIVVGPAKDKHAVESVIYQALEPFGGSVSAEHGIGLEKKEFLSCSRQAPELALMRAIKRTLDPENILNPGKIF